MIGWGEFHQFPIIILFSSRINEVMVKKTWLPVLLVTVICLSIVLSVIWRSGGDPLALARIGTRFSQGEPGGSEGYDGQFVIYIARTLQPQQVESKLDVPAYRYQRILLPALARVFSLGEERLIPWVVILINLLSHLAAVFILGRLLEDHGVNPWYAALYGLWVGSLLAIRLDLPEPLAYGLVIFAVAADKKGRPAAAWILYGLAVFTKEVTLIFVAARGLVAVRQKRWLYLVGLVGLTVVPFGVFQLWLKSVYGSYGIGSGGAMATSFEWLPLMGLLRVGFHSWKLLAIYLILFGPFLIYPAVVGIRRLYQAWKASDVNFGSLAYGLHGLLFLFLPFSTYREPGGLLRFANGLMLSVILFMFRNQPPAFKKYLPLVLILNLFLWEG